MFGHDNDPFDADGAVSAAMLAALAEQVSAAQAMTVGAGNFIGGPAGSVFVPDTTAEEVDLVALPQVVSCISSNTGSGTTHNITGTSDQLEGDSYLEDDLVVLIIASDVTATDIIPDDDDFDWVELYEDNIEPAAPFNKRRYWIGYRWITADEAGPSIEHEFTTTASTALRYCLLVVRNAGDDLVSSLSDDGTGTSTEILFPEMPSSSSTPASRYVEPGSLLLTAHALQDNLCVILPAEFGDRVDPTILASSVFLEVAARHDCRLPGGIFRQSPVEIPTPPDSYFAFLLVIPPLPGAGSSSGGSGGGGSSSVPWSSITGTPTTLAGYGITDGGGGGSTAWADITGTPTTLAGYGITDGATDAELAAAIAAHEAASNPHPQYLTPAEGDAAYSALGHTHAFADLTGKPTTLSGYGITDATEAAQDAVGGILTDSGTINFAYNDAGPSITGDVILAGKSITEDGSGLELDGDEASPGNSKLYGTNGSGVKGWYAQPSGSGSRTEGTLAAAGSTQGDAAAITTDAVDVSGADGTKGVILPSTAGAIVALRNNALSTLKVYPPSGATLGGGAINDPDSLTASGKKLYVRITSTAWYSVAIT